VSQTPDPPRNPEETYRFYIDESGDHVIRATDDLAHRYLCLLGCWFRVGDVLDFHRRLDAFKQAHIPHSPDEPVILHREEIVNSRKQSILSERGIVSASRFGAEIYRVVEPRFNRHLYDRRIDGYGTVFFPK